ncbi:hypothetical protein ykris0001_35550 [Yersinia kristensenii ATCC 33638]|nr:hypothetical protein ykris0001_21960 [Yersinia kristensenii ATCC 33638]EEP93424.1 hypothetical protein ykris0001_35550 [Yersinia kristensenii ATCC 33638]
MLVSSLKSRRKSSRFVLVTTDYYHNLLILNIITEYFF